MSKGEWCLVITLGAIVGFCSWAGMLDDPKPKPEPPRVTRPWTDEDDKVDTSPTDAAGTSRPLPDGWIWIKCIDGRYIPMKL